MRSTLVKMKDGRVYCGPIWEWKPREGYFTIVDTEDRNDGKPIRIALCEVAEASTRGARDHADQPLDYVRDELARAQKDGWTP